MLAIVCKSDAGVDSLVKYEQYINGRYVVICLEDSR